MPKFRIIIPLIITLIIGWAVIYNMNQTANSQPTNNPTTNTIRYIPIGDSYTIGNGVPTDQNWPSLLTKHLQNNGVDIDLVTNPAVSGWTTQMAIDQQIPILEKSQPTFVTILIGANDAFRNRDVETYKQQLNELIDRTQSLLPNKQRIVLLTIPNFLISPQAKEIGSTTDDVELLKSYNRVIQQAAEERQLPLVDLYEVSNQMTDQSYYISDGLHPSIKSHQLWEAAIYPVILNTLNL